MTAAEQQAKSPEEWEAIDHINNLKDANRHVDLPSDCPNVCSSHGPMFHSILPALIWMIRHMDRKEKHGQHQKSVRVGSFEINGYAFADIARAALVAAVLYLILLQHGIDPLRMLLRPTIKTAVPAHHAEGGIANK